jgi:ubiquinone/menaquinone biosynthesis C-methylase UbiE
MSGYTDVWTQDEDLESLQLRIHDGATLEQLHERADTYRRQMFEQFFPSARPSAGDRVLEVGSGVGWIMQAMIEAYPAVSEVVGLDIAENMIRKAQERWTDPRARWELYDGFHFPFPGEHFQVAYSCAALQHVEKHHAFFVFKEMHRVLAPGGHAVIHLMPTQMLSRVPTSFEEECRNHVENRTDVHWHHYYSFDELIEIFGNVIGVEDLDIRVDERRISLFVHFSKGTGRRFLRDELADISYPDRAEAQLHALTTQLAAQDAKLQALTAQLARSPGPAVRKAVRTLAPRGTRRGAAVTFLARKLVR